MKQNFLKLTLMGLVISCCVSCEYRDYEKVYDKDGVVLLRKKGSKEKFFAGQPGKKRPTFMPFNVKGVDPDDGREIDDAALALEKINYYQSTLPAGDRTTRYVDMYFNNVKTYLEAIAFEANGTADTEDLTKMGLRFYFAKESNGSKTVVVGPIFKTNILDTNRKYKVKPLWRTDPSLFKSFNFGSLCPDNCSNNDDLTGINIP